MTKYLLSAASALCGLLVAAPQLPAQSAAPRYRVTFEGRPVKGLSAASLIQLPAACTSDGTIFVHLFDPAPVISPSDPAGEFLALVPPSGDVRAIRLSDVGAIHGVRELSYYASDSEIVFLAQAFEGSTSSDEGKAADRHFYAITFGRDGKHHDTIRLDDAMNITQVGIFESGTFLAYGFDEMSRAPRLALLSSDGSLLKYLEPGEGTLPGSVMHKGPDGKGLAVYLSRTQLVHRGRSIIVVQNRTDYPLLEIDEGGAIRTIRPSLPHGETVNTLIPSDGNLFARANEFKDGLVYEIDPRNGKVLKRIELNTGVNPMCAQEGKFISLQPDPNQDGVFLFFVGTLEPTANSDRRISSDPTTIAH